MIIRLAMLLVLVGVGTGCARQGVIGGRLKTEPMLQVGLELFVTNSCADSILVESLREPQSPRGDRKARFELAVPYGRSALVAVSSLPRQGMEGRHYRRVIRIRIWGYDRSGKRLGGASWDYVIYIRNLQNLVEEWHVEELRGPNGQNICIPKKEGR